MSTWQPPAEVIELDHATLVAAPERSIAVETDIVAIPQSRAALRAYMEAKAKLSKAAGQHTHDYTIITGKALVPLTSREKLETDQLRSLKRGSSDNGQFRPYDYQADDRVILYRECSCGHSFAVDMGTKEAMRELYVTLKEIK